MKTLFTLLTLSTFLMAPLALANEPAAEATDHSAHAAEAKTDAKKDTKKKKKKDDKAADAKAEKAPEKAPAKEAPAPAKKKMSDGGC